MDNVEWFSVKDNLPADNKRLYLCCVAKNGTQRYSIGVYDYINENEKCWIIFDELNYNVTHWAYFKYIDE